MTPYTCMLRWRN